MRKEGSSMKEIINVGGHYEVYEDGKFVCSGDNKKEREEDE